MNARDPRVTKNITDLAATLADIDDSGFIVDFLFTPITPAELADIASRWALVKALKMKATQRKIAKDLGISLCKITKGSNVLKNPESAFARLLVKEGNE